MANWYCSSVAHAAVPVFAISTGYTVGQFVRRITSTPRAQWVMRCTTAGTSAASEPAWATGDGATTSTGTAVFTNVTGQSTYGWSAAAGDMPSLRGAISVNRFEAGDTIFVSSDHAEAQTAPMTYGSGEGIASSFALARILSVNRAGSVPPVAADLLPGAVCSVSTSLTLTAICPIYSYGVTYATTASGGIFISGTGNKTFHMAAGQLFLNGAGAGQRIQTDTATVVVLDNSTVKFTNVSQRVNCSSAPMELICINTPGGLLGSGSTVPGALFGNILDSTAFAITIRGVDLSALTTTLATFNVSGNRILLDSCKIAPGLVRYNSIGVGTTADVVELVNCYNGTNFISERWVAAGAITTEFTITLAGGATDDVGQFSHKMVSNTNIDKYVNPLAGFWMDVGYATLGVSKTATVEIISSASLNNDEISLLLEYQGTTGSSVASFATSLPATVLTAASAVTASTATWNSSPAMPVKQKLQVTFTPRTAGRVRGQVRLGKASTTVYVNPQVTIT